MLRKSSVSKTDVALAIEHRTCCFSVKELDKKACLFMIVHLKVA